jgi:CheY-like chemotaxis protein
MLARVLVVEDDALIADLIQAYLEELGHAVVGPANTLAEAIAMIEREPVDCAILDVSLGREESFPAADALAQRNVPFAFATGYGQSAVPDRFMAKPVLRKPFLFDDIKDLSSSLCI